MTFQRVFFCVDCGLLTRYTKSCKHPKSIVLIDVPEGTRLHLTSFLQTYFIPLRKKYAS